MVARNNLILPRKFAGTVCGNAQFVARSWQLGAYTQVSLGTCLRDVFQAIAPFNLNGQWSAQS